MEPLESCRGHEPGAVGREAVDVGRAEVDNMDNGVAAAEPDPGKR